MGDLQPVVPFQGKHGIYHCEFEAHHQPTHVLTGELGQRRIKGILIEPDFSVEPESNARRAMKLIDSKSLPESDAARFEAYRRLLESAKQNGTDVWAGDTMTVEKAEAHYTQYSLRSVGFLAALATWAFTRNSSKKQASAASTSDRPKEKAARLSRRQFLKKAANITAALSAGALGATVVNDIAQSYDKQPTTRNGRPEAAWPWRVGGATYVRELIGQRDEIGAAKLTYIARYYQNGNTKDRPNVGSLYGSGHAHLAQLVEDPETEKAVRERAHTDPAVPRMYRFHWDDTHKDWQLEEHNLFGGFVKNHGFLKELR